MIHGGVGAINESDVSLASASNAIIIGFNVRPDATAKSIADREKVDLRLYRVMDGKFQRGCSCRITRDGEQIFEGALASLKRFKDDVKEVATGYECGLVFEGFDKMKEFDVVEAYIMVEVPR